MGISASSLLDEAKCNYIRGEAENKLKEFSPYYRKQFSVAHFAQVEDDLEHNKEKITQLLKQKATPEEGELLYEEAVFYFDDTRKWRERYVVVRANYCLECHDSLETFIKGVPPRHKLLPTGGTVLTTEEAYMAMVDKCFPGDSGVKEEFAPPLPGMPGQFPVYLRLPYRRDSYFCFRQQAKQADFLSILSDCIRHQNQDFLKKKTCEVQAFLKAVQLHRQDAGHYEAWDMLMGSDVRVMANLVMEQLLPSLEKDVLPRLKAKKTEKKKVWFATVEAAYILVQEHLLEGLSMLKEECRSSARQQEVQIHSDMDQILSSRRQLEENIRAKVSEPAERLCSDSVQPYLGSVLDELMEPVSSGFLEGRQLSEAAMDQVCHDVLQGTEGEELKKALADMARPNLLSCYQKIGSLQERLQNLKERFGFSSTTGVIHSAQIDLQQLMENAAYTFQQLLSKAIEDHPDSPGEAIEKAKHRVLKQYDYDSSTVRKRIFQDALVSITLPFIKKNLAPTCKAELQTLEQTIYSDHANFLHVENVYESILLQILDKEVSKVVKEAASLKKHNLITDSRDLLSRSSRSSLSSPTVSTPSSPALSSPVKSSKPPSPLVANGLPPSLQKEEDPTPSLQKEENLTPSLQKEEGLPLSIQKEEELKMSLQKEEDLTPILQKKEEELTQNHQKEEDMTQSLQKEEDLTSNLKKEEDMTPTKASEREDFDGGEAEETPDPSEAQDAAAPQTLTQREVSVETTAAEPGEQSLDSPQEAEPAVLESPGSVQSPAKAGCPDETNKPENPPTGGGETEEGSEEKTEAPFWGGDNKLKQAEAEPAPSDPNSLDVLVGSESAPSDLESSDEASATSDVLEIIEAPLSSDQTAEVQTERGELPTPTQTELKAHQDQDTLPEEGGPPSPDAQPLDCIKEIRSLVVEVIEVEEPVQHYQGEE
ncbi:protein Niban 1-like [Menidia menidia]